MGTTSTSSARLPISATAPSENGHLHYPRVRSGGLTFDDVLLQPGFSEVLPRETDLRTQLTPEIQLNVPIISAAMDTVTEYQLAIAMASEGGIGFVHKNLTIERQADHVRRVKRYVSGLIVDPLTLNPDDTLADAFKMMADQRIGGIPITDADRRLVGILTNRDIRFHSPSAQPIREIMTRDGLITVPEGTSLEAAEEVLRRSKIEKLPVIDAQGRLVGLITYKDILKRKDFPNACKDHLGRLRVGAAVGVTADTFDRIEGLLKAGADVIAIDTAHGHSAGVLRMVRAVRERWGDLQLVAGNVGTSAATLALIEAGASAVKVGIGPGSICTTRIVTGVGVPQLTAIMDAASVAKPKGIPIIADGGIKYSGDVVKALAAGADTIMAGNLFAGTDESPGETILFEGRKFKTYRGMGSVEAMAEGSKDRYFQDVEDDIRKLVPEGIVGRVAFKGKVSEVIYQLVGGIRAGLGYCGCPDLPTLQREAEFVQISSAGLRESHAHDVKIIRESPNYSQVQ
jgi:IMP dehydrogenase